jgi:hypothetical protein
MYKFVWSEVLTAVVIFWHITPCSPIKVNRRFGGTRFILVSFSAYSTLKMEATCSSETLVDFRWTKRRYIPQDRALDIHISFDRIRGGLISLWLYKENNKLRDWKNVFTLHISPLAPHTYDFVVLTSLTHPRKIILLVLQIGKAKDLSAPLRRSFPPNNATDCPQRRRSQ